MFQRFTGTTDGTEASTTTTTDVAAKTKTITGNAAVLDKLLIAGVTYTFKNSNTGWLHKD